MATISVEVDKTTMNFISVRSWNTSSYLSKLIKEDMLLNEISDSKKSWINTLDDLSDLDS